MFSTSSYSLNDMQVLPVTVKLVLEPEWIVGVCWKSLELLEGEEDADHGWMWSMVEAAGLVSASWRPEDSSRRQKMTATLRHPTSRISS